MAALSRIERITRRGDLLAIFAMVFLADIAIGIYRTTFSLFAYSLGATLTMIGILGSIEGLMGILFSVPIGALSDRLDRRIVLGGGLLLFTVSYGFCAFVRNPIFLYPIRAMTGLSVASTFYLGIAFVSDIVDRPDQGLSIGIYTTCMGVGFAIGSAIGGRVAEDFGYSAGFCIAAIVVLASFALLRWGPARQSARPRPVKEGTTGPMSARLALLTRNPGLLAASIGYLGIAMSNEGAIYNFFPLYAASLGIGQAAIGSMFSVRVLASASARLPTGALVNRLSSRRLMTVAMVLAITSLTGIAFSQSPAVLTILLAVEGMAFGMYFAASSAAVAEHTTEANRGAATGLLIMAGSIGTTLGPVVLGQSAARWGLNAVYLVTATVLLAGLVVILSVHSRGGRRVDEAAQ